MAERAREINDNSMLGDEDGPDREQKYTLFVSKLDAGVCRKWGDFLKACIHYYQRLPSRSPFCSHMTTT